MPSVRVNGIRLAYDDEGEGPPLVLVHGSWTNRRGWDVVAPRLAERFRVVRHDRRGHSESEDAPGTLDEDASDIAALAEELDLGPIHLACSSRGGVVGLKLAAARPDLVRSITCHEPPIFSVVRDEAFERELGRVAAMEEHVVALIEAGKAEEAARAFVEEIAFGAGAWDRLPRWIKAMFVENAHTFADEHRDAAAHDVDLAALRRFGGRVLLTSSDDSPPWLGMVVDRLADVLPRVERHRYRAAGHNPQGTQPEAYVELVGGFIGRAETA